MIGEKIVYAILFLAEAVTAWLYASYIYTAKRSHIYTCISFTFGYLLLFVVAQYGAVMINIGMFFAVNTVILGLNFSCKIKSAVLHAAFLTLIVGISEILVNLLITYITDDYTAYMDSFSAFVSLVVFSKLLYFFITGVAARLFKPHKGVNKEPNQILLLCVMPFVSVIVIAAFVYIGMTGQLVGLAEILAAISSFALLLVNIAVLLIYNRLQKLDEEHAVLQMSKMRDKADAEYYEMLQQQYDGQRILIHDIKRHFSVIDLMAEDGDNQKIREYISELEDLPEFRRKARLCDDPILNMVLLRNQEYCAANGINFSCDIRADSVSFMDAISITALFGNLLSNAIEAAENSESKMVELSVVKKEQQNCILISMVNSCDMAPIKDANGNFETGKDKSKGHGYGTKSIARVIQKYNGEADMRYDEEVKEFHSIIRFPVHS